MAAIVSPAWWGCQSATHAARCTCAAASPVGTAARSVIGDAGQVPLRVGHYRPRQHPLKTWLGDELRLAGFLVGGGEQHRHRSLADVAVGHKPLIVDLHKNAGGQATERGIVWVPLCQGGLLGVGEEGAVDDTGEVSLQAASRLTGVFPLGAFAIQVYAGVGVPAGLNHRDGADGEVEFAVAAAVEPVSW